MPIKSGLDVKHFNWTRWTFIVLAWAFCLSLIWIAVSSGQEEPADTQKSCWEQWQDYGEQVAIEKCETKSN